MQLHVRLSRIRRSSGKGFDMRRYEKAPVRCPCSRLAALDGAPCMWLFEWLLCVSGGVCIVVCMLNSVLCSTRYHVQLIVMSTCCQVYEMVETPVMLADRKLAPHATAISADLHLRHVTDTTPATSNASPSVADSS